METCQALAANLTAYYKNAAAYDSAAWPNLTAYLQRVGVLVSMFLGEPENMIPLQPPASETFRLSASWIQESTTGPHIFGNSTMDMFPGIGIVFDPAVLDVACIYPLDGVTEGRLDHGCGDLHAESEDFSWWQRQWIRAMVKWRKFRHFRHTDWKDIPCSEFFEFAVEGDDDDHDFDPPPAMVDKQQNSMDWDTYLMLDELTQVLGYSVCYPDRQPSFSNDALMLAYIGSEPWTPDEWSQNAAITQHVVQEHPTNRGIWNEIVLDYPVDDDKRDSTWVNPMIQAVFYLPSYSTEANKYTREVAFHQAERFGNKPVLVLDPLDFKEHLFSCAPLPTQNAKETTQQEAGASNVSA